MQLLYDSSEEIGNLSADCKTVLVPGNSLRERGLMA